MTLRDAYRKAIEDLVGATEVWRKTASSFPPVDSQTAEEMTEYALAYADYLRYENAMKIAKEAYANSVP